MSSYLSTNTQVQETDHRLWDMKDHALPWARFFGRCRARLPQRYGYFYYGRCELKRHHGSMHAIECGMEIVKWRLVGE